VLLQDLAGTRLVTEGSPDAHRESGHSNGAAPPLLALDGIVVNFGGVTAVDDVSLRADAGEVVGIIGPNGAGKTTLFDVVSGVRVPNRGRVLLDGNDMTRKSSAVRARNGLRRTFQRVQVFGWLTVEDNVLAALECRGGGGGFAADLVAFPTRRRHERERRRRVAEVLERCGLNDVRGELAAALPIGIARMVELARAIGAEIQHLRSETQCSVLLVEHDAGFVMQQCDRIVVLDRGAVLAEGLPDEIQGDVAVRNAYLGDSHEHSEATE
jgi:branched-chain amino acid transport system ATP-binding protein